MVVCIVVVLLHKKMMRMVLLEYSSLLSTEQNQQQLNELLSCPYKTEATIQIKIDEASAQDTPGVTVGVSVYFTS